MKDKVVIVTGGSSGIGLACVKEFAQNGARVCFCGRNQEKLFEVESALQQQGLFVKAVKADVSIEADCENLIKQTIDHFGKIDILVNNAGISMRALFSELNLDVIRKVMDINFWGTVYCTKYAYPYLLQSQGSIVGISSITGFVALPARTGYAASKYAMNGFLETLRMENLTTGLHVMIVAPGFTASNIRKTALTHNGTPQGKTPRVEEDMMSPEKVARKLQHGIKRRKRTLVLTTQGRLTILINKFFPKLLDKLVYRHMAKEPDSPFQ